jgi:hypothetical protein
MRALQLRDTFFLVVCFTSLFLVQCTSKPNIFTRLPAQKTGVDFINRIQETDSFNIFTFEYIYNGGGVGVGDFNNDGLQDLFFAGNAVSSQLYLNKGAFSFQKITKSSGTETAAWCTGVAVVDINQDGWKDIYISTAFPDQAKATPNLLFLNKGLGKDNIPRFTEVAAQVGLADSAYGTQAAFFDFDRDGDLDVYLCINSAKERDRNALIGQKNDGTGQSQDKLFRNDGTSLETGLPRFVNVSKEAGIQTEGWGLGVVVKDVSQDGWPDVYVANDYQSNDHLYINNRNGTFTNKIATYLAHQCHNAMGVDIADCNNDGYEDICVVDMLPDDNQRQKSMFGSIPNDKYAQALRMGYQPQFVRNMLQLNNGPLPDTSGDVVFSDIGYLAGIAATDWSWSPLWGDFNLDGWKDLLITNGYGKDITDLDFATYMNEFRMFGEAETKVKALRQKVGELNDVKKPNWLFQNNGDLTFTNKAALWGLEESCISNGAAYADLDNDGDLDLVMNNLNEEAFVYQNNTINKKQKQPSPNYLRVQLNGSKGNREGIGAKLTLWSGGLKQYAEQALQRGYLSSMDSRICFGLRSISVADSLLVEWPSGKRQVLKQLTANQIITLDEKEAVDQKGLSLAQAPRWLGEVLVPSLSASRHEENEFSDFDYQYTVPHRYSIQGPSMAVADVDGDGRDDVYMGGASRHSGVFFLQKGNEFEKKIFGITPENKRQEETGTLLFDADGDGDNDLYCVGGGNEFGDSAAYQDLFFLNDGKGNFSDASAALPNTSASGSCVIAADYDGDGDLDLFVGGRVAPQHYPEPARSYLLRNDSDPQKGVVKFTDVTSELCPQLVVPGIVSSAIWTDYNNDSYADLFVVGEFMPLSLYRNSAGKRFDLVSVPAFEHTAGWYNSVAAGDFDNDGDMDYVAGNLGLNSKYKASLSQPVSVRYNDFDKNGSQDAFLFSYNNGKEYPAQTRTTVTEQIPSLRKRAYYFSDYGKMGYDDLFTKAERDAAKQVQAYQMASLYVENKGGGLFGLTQLPMMAQLAPVFGILPMDVDRDGNLDIVAVGNSYAPEALTGRYDASYGWVLRGTGKGQFTPVAFRNSGFIVPGDARSLVKLSRGDGTCLLLAGINSAPLKTFQMNERVRCENVKKNETSAIYTLTNGQKRRDEFFFGSSYLSQQGRFLILDNTIKSVQIFSGSSATRTMQN